VAARHRSSSPDLDQLLFPVDETGPNELTEENPEANSLATNGALPGPELFRSEQPSGAGDACTHAKIPRSPKVPAEKEGAENETLSQTGGGDPKLIDWLAPERVSYLRLALVEGIGPRTFRFLLARFGTPAEVLRAPRSLLLQVPRIGPVLAERIASAPSEDQVVSLLQLCESEGIGILCPETPTYPALLRHLNDPPLVLFLRGELKPADHLAVAIVGTRHPTPYGLKQAERLAAELAAAGFTVVSGLARGIDAAAHRGALNAGGRTIAILAGGLLRIYPPEHAPLASKIEQQGALLSEALPHDAPVGQRFPKRNRIISGLSWGTVVVEAGDHSGALITAHHALEQGREVFAVPGRADDRTARGCNRLIRDGATMVLSAEDIVEVLRPLICRSIPRGGGGPALPQNVPSPRGAGSSEVESVPNREQNLPPMGGDRSLIQLAQLSESERRVLSAVGQDPTCIDQIVQKTGLPSSEVLASISLLEIRRLIRRLGGNWVCLR